MDTELKRVNETIGDTVLTFCKRHLGQTFYMSDLTNFVDCHGCLAPDSPGRILRLLRRQGLIAYRVVSRPNSLYEIQAVHV